MSRIFGLLLLGCVMALADHECQGNNCPVQVNTLLQARKKKEIPVVPLYKFFGPGDGKCTEQGYEVIETPEDCELAGKELGMKIGYDGQHVGPHTTRPAGCYCMGDSHCHLNKYVDDDGPGGGGFGYNCRQVVSYKFFGPRDGKCTDQGYEVIQTPEDCELSGKVLGMRIGYDGQHVGPHTSRPAGCYCMKDSHCHLNKNVKDAGPGGEGGFGYNCKQVLPPYKFFGPTDGKCTDQGYEVIQTPEDCELAGKALGMKIGYDGQHVGPHMTRPAGCYCMKDSHCHLNKNVEDAGPGGGGFGYNCRRMWLLD